MMAVVVGTFILCWSPFAFMFFSFPFNDVDEWFLAHPWSIEIITWLGNKNIKFMYLLETSWSDHGCLLYTSDAADE